MGMGAATEAVKTKVVEKPGKPWEHAGLERPKGECWAQAIRSERELITAQCDQNAQVFRKAILV